MKFNLQLRKKVSLATIIFAICFILLVILAFIVFDHFNSLKKYNKQAVHAYTIINQLSNTESLLKDAETGARGFLITKDSDFLRPLFNAKRLLDPFLDTLGKLVNDNYIQRKDYGIITKLSYEELSISNSLSLLALQNDKQKDSLLPALMLTSKNIMKKYRVTTRHMMNIETDQLTFRKKQINYYQSKLLNNFTLLFIMMLFIITALSLWIFIEFRKRINYQISLEENIINLNQNNAELEQIAFAASHDLQEPLRKIRIFSDRLRMVTKNNLQSESQLIVERINRSAIQLHGLISDLVELTNIVQAKHLYTAVSLDNILLDIEKELKQNNTENNYKIIKADMPLIRGSAEHLKKLFLHLFSNAFAFKSPERSLVVIISTQKIKSTDIKILPAQSALKEYYHIKFQDNGIGFNEAFKEKLFMPFQRLHNYGSDDLKRKGMGLAICKRIMVNHGGWIDGDGDEQKGAAIHLYFPVNIL